MDPSKLRKRQIARRLGVSEQILDQYLQLKRAEVLQANPPESEPATPGGDASGSTGFGSARSASGRGSGTSRTTPSRGPGRLRSGPPGTTRGSHRD